jgi:hypothetical protein
MPQAELAGLPTVKSAWVGTVLVQVCCGDPSDAEWDGVIRSLDGRPEGLAITPVMVNVERGAPTATQRKKMIDAMAGRSQRTCILTTSVSVRGVVTAFSWFMRDVRAFAPSDFAPACEFLHVSPVEGDRLKTAVDGLRRELGLAPLFAVARP